MTTYERNIDICRLHSEGMSTEDLAIKYGLSRGRISEIIRKYDSKKDPFYLACMQACDKLEKKHQFATYAYDILKENGIVDHILAGNINLMDFSDNDLKAFRGIGNNSIDILRVAWGIFTKRPVQETLELDPVVLRGYTTGNDLIRWIQANGLGDKKIYYMGDDRIGFEIATRNIDGMDYKTCADLRIFTGEVIKFADDVHD